MPQPLAVVGLEKCEKTMATNVTVSPDDVLTLSRYSTQIQLNHESPADNSGRHDERRHTNCSRAVEDVLSMQLLREFPSVSPVLSASSVGSRERLQEERAPRRRWSP